MNTFGKSSCKRFFTKQRGLTVVEYVVAAALLVGAVTVVFIALEIGLSTSFQNSISSIGQ